MDIRYYNELDNNVAEAKRLLRRVFELDHLFRKEDHDRGMVDGAEMASCILDYVQVLAANPDRPCEHEIKMLRMICNAWPQKALFLNLRVKEIPRPIVAEGEEGAAKVILGWDEDGDQRYRCAVCGHTEEMPADIIDHYEKKHRGEIEWGPAYQSKKDETPEAET